MLDENANVTDFDKKADDQAAKPSKLEVLPNSRARKSVIPLLRALKSGHAKTITLKEAEATTTIPTQPPRFSYNYPRGKLEALTASLLTPSLSPSSLPKKKGNSDRSNEIKISGVNLPTVPGGTCATKGANPPSRLPIAFAPRRNCRSVHSSIIRSTDGVSSEGSKGGVSSEGQQLESQEIQQRQSESVPEKLREEDAIEEKEEGMLILNFKISPEATQLPSYLISKFSLEVGKTADRTRGYFMCPICNEPFCNPAIIACGHLFCIRCVSGWFEDQDNCPCCRYPIVMKDGGSSSVLTKDFPEVTSVLLSSLTTANFYANLQERQAILPSSQSIHVGALGNSEESCLLSCEYSSKFLNCIAPIFREMFQKTQVKPSSSTNRNGTSSLPHADPEIVKVRNSFLAALWYLRQGLTLHHTVTTSGGVFASQTEADTAIIKNFPSLTKEEADRGIDSSREAFLTKVMSMKPPKTPGESENSSQPSLDQLRLRRKLVNNTMTRATPTFRFRMPSSVGLKKMFLASSLFIVIFLAVALFDDLRRGGAVMPNKFQFSKMDLFVFLVTVLTLIAHTETERVAFWRRQGRNRRGMDRERGNRRRNRIRRSNLRIGNLFVH